MPITEICGPDDFTPRAPPPAASRAVPVAAAAARPLRPSLEWTPAVERATAPLYERVRSVIPSIEWPLLAPTINAINELKRARRAVIIAHNYQSPEIFHCVADIRGDSLQLAIEASRVDADIIVQCGVHFMAETAKLLNPDKTVLIPDSNAGCSLAASITAEDVRRMRQRFPGVPVVAYVNTSVEVKAEVDICCTSSNAVSVVESLGAQRVIFLPDQHLARYVASQTAVEIIGWKGACEVHERFTGEELRSLRQTDPSLRIIAHPECPQEVLAEADFTGSTAHMINWVRIERPKRLVMVTECAMADNVQAEVPEVEMLRPCNLCPHMKKITLSGILDSLLTLGEEVTIDPALAAPARRAVERMINLKN